ncbi:MAG: hypothetical protein M1130_11730 [Actinobacteria bacterium]|nr:hypothetical protein [Actinomycetota bacterium]
MEKKSGKKEIITKMRPDPDFRYLARRATALRKEGQSLASDINRDPGEIPGFYAEEHRE